MTQNNEERCTQTIFESPWRSHLCMHPAITQTEDGPRCKIHDPARHEARIEEQLRKWNEDTKRRSDAQVWDNAAKALCGGVSTAELERLGSGWLKKHLEEAAKG